jgi:putative oxidoreductase
MNTGLLILRLVIGFAMAAHGAQKLFGWYGGGGIKGTAAYLEKFGFQPGTQFAVIAGLFEFLGGLLLALGLINPIAAALMVSVMVVAIGTVHLGNGLFATNNGFELPLLYLTGALATGFTGPGDYSLDHALGFDSTFPEMTFWAALAIGLLGALANLAMRNTAQRQPSRSM